MEDTAVLRPLYDAYLQELVAAGATYTRDAAGHWQPDYFPYWTQPHPTKLCWLLLLEGRAVGFAFVGKRPFPYMSELADQRLVEFYVVPEHRRANVGRAAAMQIFDALSGRWELSELPGNSGATAFWRSVLRAYAVGGFSDTVEDGEPTQRFVSRALAG